MNGFFVNFVFFVDEDFPFCHHKFHLQYGMIAAKLNDPRGGYMRVLMADDHALFRDGMHYVLQQLDAEVEILEAGNFSDALHLAEQHPDIALVLLDLYMPGSEGALSVRVFNHRHPDMPLVVVSGSDLRSDIERVMEFGAMGFISKMSSSKVMLSALKMVLEGAIYLPPQLLQQSLSEAQSSERTNQHGLTARQVQVLQHLSLGITNKEIAQAVGLAEGTVKIHLAGIYLALRVNTRSEAVHTARRLGLLPAAQA